MNWEMILVIGTVLLSVSTALWVIFSSSKDSCRYLRYYSKKGYHPQQTDESWTQTR